MPTNYKVKHADSEWEYDAFTKDPETAAVEACEAYYDDCEGEWINRFEIIDLEGNSTLWEVEIHMNPEFYARQLTK